MAKGTAPSNIQDEFVKSRDAARAAHKSNSKGVGVIKTPVLTATNAAEDPHDHTIPPLVWNTKPFGVPLPQ